MLCITRRERLEQQLYQLEPVSNIGEKENRLLRDEEYFKQWQYLFYLGSPYLILANSQKITMNEE